MIKILFKLLSDENHEYLESSKMSRTLIRLGSIDYSDYHTYKLKDYKIIIRVLSGKSRLISTD